jgi:hypothetical protein
VDGGGGVPFPFTFFRHPCFLSGFCRRWVTRSSCAWEGALRPLSGFGPRGLRRPLQGGVARCHPQLGASCPRGLRRRLPCGPPASVDCVGRCHSPMWASCPRG